jgi:proton-dependent oligopeptide transporter, POT family
VKELVEAFRALKTAPRALWLVIFAFSVDAAAYFGVLPLMTSYLKTDLGVAQQYASVWVSVFTCAVTFVMLGMSKPIEDRLGIRFGIILALTLSTLGRALYGSAALAGGLVTLTVALLVTALGEGLLQPVAYAGIKKYTDAKSGAMGYALLYGFMNLAAGSIGPLSAHVRTSWDEKKAAGQTVLSGFNAVNWACWGVTLFTLVVFASLMTKKAAAVVVREAGPPQSTDASGKKIEGPSPFTDPRFLFFVFALLPVRTLFAHQWLTMPEYVLNSFPKWVTDKMEWFVDSANPLLIFLLVPVVTAFTRKYHVVTMMIIGSGVSAASTFLLSFGPNPLMLALYFLIFSIGEALWSSRFLEYAAELAPEGRVAQYMGVANIPWIVAKFSTGLYSGYMLKTFVPPAGQGPDRSGTMWAIYGCVALVSPIALLAARKWVLSGMAVKDPAPAADEAPAAAA